MPGRIQTVTRYGGLTFPKIPPILVDGLTLPKGAPDFAVRCLTHTRVREATANGQPQGRQDPGALYKTVAPTAGPANVAINFGEFDIPSAVSTALVKGDPLDGEIRRGYRAMGVDYRDSKVFNHDPHGPYYGIVWSPEAWGPIKPKVKYYLAGEAALFLKRGDFDWKEIFKSRPSVYAHTDGIFLAVGHNTPPMIRDFHKVAGEEGAICTFDNNVRPGPLKSIYGPDYLRQARRIYGRIVRQVDILFGNKDDFDILGIKPPKFKPKSPLDMNFFKEIILKTVKKFPNLKAVLANLGHEIDANHFLWSALLYIDGQFYEAPIIEVFGKDRIGRGDATTFGLLLSLMKGKSPQDAIDFACAAGALCMGSFGDTLKVDSLEDISDFAKAIRSGGNVFKVER